MTLFGIGGVALAKTFGVALAVGLDVFALSVAIGIAGIAWKERARVGLAFVGAELIMQVVGVLIGAGAGRLLGEIAAYAGFAVLALLGAWMVKESFADDDAHSALDATKGWGCSPHPHRSVWILWVSVSHCLRSVFRWSRCFRPSPSRR